MQPNDPGVTPDVPAPAATAWDTVKRLHDEGASDATILDALKTHGLDGDEARILLNAARGALPTDLPTAQLTGGTHVLAPSAFVFSDLGLKGPPATIGLYYLSFGLALLGGMGLAALFDAAGIIAIHKGFAFYSVRLCGTLAVLCVGWGALKTLRALRIRRR